jgi:hypothetical protein
VEGLFFLGIFCKTIIELNKACFFFNQARKVCDISRSVNFKRKANILMELGDLSVLLKDYTSATLLYKKV